MDTPKIFDSELKLCEILWQHQPVKSSELVRLCADQLGWKKSTTYTVIKRLTDRRMPPSPPWWAGRTCSAPRAAPSSSATSVAACPASSTPSWAARD